MMTQCRRSSMTTLSLSLLMLTLYAKKYWLMSGRDWAGT
jgi:hypothetical protein